MISHRDLRFDPNLPEDITFLDLLPDEVMDNISRKVLFKDGFKRTWSLLMCPAALRRAYGRTFSTIMFLDYETWVYARRDLLYLGAQNDEADVESLLMHLNPNIQEVDVRCRRLGYYKEEDVQIQFKENVQLVIKYCPNVKQLRIRPEPDAKHLHDGIIELIRGYRVGLKKVTLELEDIDSLPFFSDIASCCTNVRIFEFKGRCLSGLSAMLSGLGNSLEEVCIEIRDVWRATENWPHVIAAMRQNCRRLQSILLLSPLIDYNRTSEADYVSFLCSYGSQLKNAHLYRISVEGCRQLRASCPNIRSNMILFEYDVDRITAVNSRLSTLVLHIDRPNIPPTWDGMKNAFAQVPNLVSLDVVLFGWQGDVYDSWMQNIFENKLLQLERFILAGSVRVSSLAIRKLGEATKKLKTLDLKLESSNCVAECAAVVSRNPLLESITLALPTVLNSDAVLETGEKTAKIFAGCNNLQKLVIEFGLRDSDNLVPYSSANMKLPHQFRRIELKLYSVPF